MSEKKAKFDVEYRKLVKQCVEFMIKTRGATWCEKCLEDGPVEPHHIFGRNGKNLLRFKLVGNDFSRCRCHNWIHAHAKLAREQGWLK